MRSTLITYNGKTQSITAWSKECKISSGGLSRRLQRGWDFERAITEPPITSTAQRYEYKGKMYTADELSILHGNICTSAMRTRLQTMSVEEAMEMPNRKPHRKVRITEKQQKRAFKPKPKKPNTTLCRSCIYHGSLSGGGGSEYGTIYCDYIEIELKRRPCPPPPNCTAYKKGKSVVRKTALKRMGKVRL